jgi:large subunit ribosomal protein L32
LSNGELGLTKNLLFHNITFLIFKKKDVVMAVPKRRRSKARKRSHKANWKAEAPTLVACKNCGSKILPHFACPDCGFYKGRQVITIKQKAVNQEEA